MGPSPQVPHYHRVPCHGCCASRQTPHGGFSQPQSPRRRSHVLQRCAPRFHCPARGVPAVPGDAAAKVQEVAPSAGCTAIAQGGKAAPEISACGEDGCLVLHPGVQESILIQAWASAGSAWPRGFPGHAQVPSGLEQWRGDRSAPHTGASHPLGTCGKLCRHGQTEVTQQDETASP